MQYEHQIKAIISKHINAMLEDLSSSETFPGWIPNNAERIITVQVFGMLEYGKDVEEYMEKEGMIKE